MWSESGRVSECEREGRVSGCEREECECERGVSVDERVWMRVSARECECD